MRFEMMIDFISAFKSTDFEHELMVNLLEGKEPFYDELRMQYRSASVIRRERSSFSSTTYYKIPSEFRPMKVRNKVFNDYRVDVIESNSELGVSLVIQNGYLSHIELSDDSGNFPANLSLLTVYKD